MKDIAFTIEHCLVVIFFAFFVVSIGGLRHFSAFFLDRHNLPTALILWYEGGAVSSFFSAATEAGQGNRILYELPARTARATIEKGLWSTGELLPMAPLPSMAP